MHLITTCLLRTGGGIPLIGFLKDTTSQLAESLSCRRQNGKVVDTIFKKFLVRNGRCLNHKPTAFKVDALITVHNRESYDI